MFKEFKSFALRGNVIDLAVAVIIGAAFGKIITSLVNDIIMPVINPLVPQGDWRTIEIGPGVKIGSFLGNIVDFLIIAFVIFLMIKGISRMKKKEEKEAVVTPPTNEEVLLREIRDILKSK
jgi:large conductance mechanosensitive channel